MPVIVYSVVRRYMKRTSPKSFTVFDGAMELPARLSLEPTETVIGWYRNPAPWEMHLVVFTSEALHLVDEHRTERLRIADIVGCEVPKSKEGVTGIHVLTPDGFRFIRVAGTFGPDGNQKDAYSFIATIRGLIPNVVGSVEERDVES